VHLAAIQPEKDIEMRRRLGCGDTEQLETQSSGFRFYPLAQVVCHLIRGILPAG
jgi:hypothetical protein